MCVCEWSIPSVVCQTSCLAKIKRTCRRLPASPPCDERKESVFSSLVIVQLVPTLLLCTPLLPPLWAANIAPLCISSSKWGSVFDVQTSFEPLWEMKLKFVPLVNRDPCSQDPTGSPLLPSLPLVGGRRLRNVICWLQMSAEEGAALLRNTVAPPCYSELF